MMIREPLLPRTFRREDLAKKMVDSYPKLWKRCCPRRYIPPNGYANPMTFSYFMMMSAIALSKGMVANDKMAGTIMMVSELSINHNVPTFFVNEDFARAVSLTNPPEDYTLGEIKWPMPAITFVLPPQFMKEYAGYECHLITIANAPAGSYPSKPFSEELPLTGSWDNDVQRIGGHYLALVDGVEVDFTSTYKGSSKISEACSEKPVDTSETWRGVEKMMGLPPADPQRDSYFLSRAVSLSIKLLLAMSARPNLIEHGALDRPAKMKKGKERDALWTPNTIGRGYRIVNERVPKEHQGGTVRMHWRRGHFRNQAYGLREAPSYKVIWIDPVLVNAE